jgi:SAM-dependent methyltransferase
MTLFGTNQTISESLDKLFARDTGIYGHLSDLPLAWQTGHFRRAELLDRLDIGDPSTLVCVDFGCGSWGFADVYPRLHQCAFAYGIDISATAIEQSIKVSTAQSRPYKDRCQYLKSDGMEIPLEDSSADLVYAGEAIEHMRYPSRFVAECYRVLRPNGQLVLTTPNKDALMYRIQNDIYGNWTEHLWLFSWPELVRVVGEFFEIEESYGFNSSIYRDLDKQATDKRAAEVWASLFEDRPDLASGLVCRGRKRSGITTRYQLSSISPDSVSVQGPSMSLATGLGLSGTMIDAPGSSVSFRAPRADGMVVVLWSHAWSGYGEIAVGADKHRVNLWAQDPGWRPFEFTLGKGSETEVRITAEGVGEERSLAPQVIFCEAFTYTR